MRIFVSFAGEQRKLAERVAIGLRQDGHDVFFDQQSLPPGEEYDRAIRRDIARCDLLVFLVSPDSVAAGTYALTELGLAQKRWPDPSGRLLPVMVAATPMADVPAYVAAVTVLQPGGEVVSEIVAAVDVISRRRRRRRNAAIAAAVAVATAAGAAWWAGQNRGDATDDVPPCRLAVRLAADAALAPGLTLRVSGSGQSRDYSVTHAGAAAIAVGAAQVGDWELTLIDRDGLLVGRLAFDRCPTAGASYQLDGGLSLELAPRS